MKKTVILLIFFLSASPAHAEVFQYFDQDGTLIITNSPRTGGRTGTDHRSYTKSIKTELKEGVYYEYYPVSGNTFNDLVHAANTYGYFEAGEGKTYPALTKWTMGWSYNFDYTYAISGDSILAGLNISEVDIKSDITVVLPELSENTVLNNADLESWNDFTRKLLAHELDHVKIITDAKYQDKAGLSISGIKELVIPYAPNSDIDALIKQAVEAETGRIGHELMREIKKSNDEYDSLTEHGLKPEMRDIYFNNH